MDENNEPDLNRPSFNFEDDLDLDELETGADRELKLLLLGGLGDLKRIFELDADLISDYLPESVKEFGHQVEFQTNMKDTLGELIHHLVDHDHYSAQSTAEEWLIKVGAELCVGEEEAPRYSAEEIRQEFVLDFDIDLLEEDNLLGLSNPMLGTMNLHPSDWFVSFDQDIDLDHHEDLTL